MCVYVHIGEREITVVSDIFAAKTALYTSQSIDALCLQLQYSITINSSVTYVRELIIILFNIFNTRLIYIYLVTGTSR